MALILSLETSGDNCSVALHNKGQVIIAEQITEPQAHARKLAILVEQAFQKAELDIHSLQAIAISSGPGSYTGLRIGTSTAKGLCYTLNIPLIAVSTLDLLVYQGTKLVQNKTLLCPMIDARRMEVYCVVADANAKVVQAVAAQVIGESSFAELLDKYEIVFYGDGAEKCKTALTHANARFIDGVMPSASSLGEIAFNKFNKQQFEDLIHFEPFYLKEFQAKKSTKPLF